jgi:hypothetical protein
MLNVAGGSCEQGPQGPSPRAPDPPPEILPLSKVDVPISVETAFLSTQITKHLPTPLARGTQSVDVSINLVTMTHERIFDPPRQALRSRIDHIPTRAKIGLSLLGVPIFHTIIVDKLVQWTEIVPDTVGHLVDSR